MSKRYKINRNGDEIGNYEHLWRIRFRRRWDFSCEDEESDFLLSEESDSEFETILNSEGTNGDNENSTPDITVLV